MIHKILFVCGLLAVSAVSAQNETIPTGSFIINMGATNPNTIANGLKPYGLIYDLIRNHNVPIKWVIGAGKVKDGVDFTYNGTQYKGGTFIIPAQYRTTAVDAKITSWSNAGVVGITTTSALTVNVTQTLTTAPKWTLDATNGAIAEDYMKNAGITNTAFPGAYNWLSPQALGVCDDLFVMPHADPTWATHSNLFTWNQTSLGSIWAACHAVSALENCINPGNTSQQMNFLSTRTSAVAPTPWPNNSLTLWKQHKDGTPPYTSRLFDDPVAQYMGATDAAHANGSEQIYLSKQNAAPNNTRWRPGVKIIAYDPTQADVTAPNLANGNVAAVMVYGRAFDDPARGYVMYEAGHDHDKGTAADVAAQRAYFNFSFFQAQFKSPSITVTGLTSGQNINSGQVVNVSASATSPLSGVTFSYLWTSSCGGTFANPTAASTTFTAPTVLSSTPCVLTCLVTDNCGRAAFQSYPVTILSSPQPPVANPDNATVSIICGSGTAVTTNVLANDSDPRGLPLTLTSVTGAINGTVSFTAAGNVTFTPNSNFTGSVTLTYIVCNNATPTALCDTSTLTITATGSSTPAAANDAFTIAEDAIGRFNVLANDASGLSVIGIISGPANGRVSVNVDNTITYLPNADYAGTDNFTYRVGDGNGGFNTANVTVTVTSDACNGGTYQTAPGVTSSVTATHLGDNILWGLDPTYNYGTCNYLDLAYRDYSSLVTNFSWAGIPVGSTINSANFTMKLQAAATTTQTFAVFRLTRAFTEGTGTCNLTSTNPSSWNVASAGNNWTTAGGDFTGNTGATPYTSTTVTNGTATGTSITWNIANLVKEWNDGTFSNFGLLLKGTVNTSTIYFHSQEATTATNRPTLVINYTTPPTCATIPTRAPMAMPDEVTVRNRATVLISTATNDYFPVAGALAYSIITPPASGTASINSTTGVITYSNNTTYNGVRSLTYRVNHTGSGLSDTATVYINITNGPINAVNDAPLPGANSGVVQTINVKVNDTDPEGAVAAATVSITTAPKNGTATVNGSNNIVYTPNVGFTGKDTLFYTLCEPVPACGSPFCDIARLIVTAINQVPNSNPFIKTILPCYANTFTLINSATDPENGVLTITNVSALSPGGSGTLVDNNDGTLTLTPATGFTGVIKFTYTVTDNGVPPQVSTPDTVTITVQNPVNNPPVAVNDFEDTTKDEILYANVRQNDSDPDNHPLTIPTIIVGPLHGTAVVNSINGQIEYTPDNGFLGTDSLRYAICDIPVIVVSTCTYGVDKCDTATLVMIVKSPVPLPVEMLYINCRQNGSSATINWGTASETDSREFIIWRSGDGRNWQPLDRLAAAGNSFAVTNYAYTDRKPLPGNNFYRLELLNADGSREESGICRAKYEASAVANELFSLYPNPADESLTLTVQPANEAPLKVEILSAEGRLIRSLDLAAAEGVITTNLNIRDLQAGMYLLQVSGEGYSRTEWFVKR